MSTTKAPPKQSSSTAAATANNSISIPIPTTTTTTTSVVSTLNPSDMIENVIGFVDRIDTPFGEMCTASFDTATNGRLYKPIEESVGKIRSNFSSSDSSNNTTSFNGNYSQSLLDYSTTSILDFFGTSTKSHLLEDCGSHEMSPYIHLSRTLTASGAFMPEKSKIYVTSSESYFNILSWKDQGFNDIETIDVNTESEVNVNALIEKITRASHATDAHLLSISSASSVTGQRIPNLQEVIEAIAKLKETLSQRKKNTKLLIALNITALTPRQVLNLSSKVYQPVDFFILHASKLIGSGLDAANLLISNKIAVNTLNSSSSAVNSMRHLLEALTNGSINAADPTRLYRTAMALQLLASVKVDSIAEIERNHVAVFLNEMIAANKDLKKASLLRSINVWGCPATPEQADITRTMQYGQLYLNVYTPGSEAFDAQNRSFIHPELLTQILHDLFGIIVSFKGSLALPQQSQQQASMVLLNIPKNLIDEQLVSRTIPDAVVGCVSIEISYLHSTEDVLYLAKALRMIGEKGEELQRYYDRKTLAMNHYTPEQYDLNLLSITTSNFGKNASQQNSDLLKSRNKKYEAQMTVAKAVFKNYQRYFSLHDGYSKEKTEQIRKNPPQGSMPPVLPPKSFMKLPGDDANNLQSDEAIQSMGEATARGDDQAHVLVKQELARLMEMRNARRVSQSLQAAEIEQLSRLAAESKQGDQASGGAVAIDGSGSSGGVTNGAGVNIKGLVKQEMEKQMKDMINLSLTAQKKDEKAAIDAMIAAMRKEMEEKIASANEYKEQFVFEDLKPSVMFKNVLEHREKRYKHLRMIFNAYAKLNQSQQEIERKVRTNNRGSGGSGANNGYIDLSANKLVIRRGDARVPSLFTINLQQYLQFCGEFNLLSQHVDASVVSQIYNRTISKNKAVDAVVDDFTKGSAGSAGSISHTSEMNFNEFVASLEKLSLVFFYDNHLLITSFDKMEALYQFMSIDDLKSLKVKLRNAEELAATVIQPINLSKQRANLAQKYQSSQSLTQILQENDRDILAAKANFKQYLDTDFLKGDQPAKILNKNSNSLSVPHYSPPPLPQSFSKPIGMGSTNGQGGGASFENNSGYSKKYQQQQSGGRVNWMKNEYIAAPLFKNESNFLNHEYAEHVPLGSGAGYGAAYMVPSASTRQQQPYHQSDAMSQLSSSSSPMKNHSEIFQSHLYQQQLPQISNNANANRIRQVQDTEAQRQKDLLVLIQNNQSNRYNPPSKRKK